MKLMNKIILSLLISVFVTLNLSANNGQDLFKQNCAACHKIEGILVGPGLKGVSAKWADAGEAENLIKWVKNSRALYETGKSEMAKLAWEISPIEMAPQAQLTDEQIKLIFDFIDADAVVVTPPKEETKQTASTPKKISKKGKILTPEEVQKQNKEDETVNRTIFILLLLVAFAIVAAIVSTSKTIQTFTTLIIKKSKKNKDETNGNKGTIISIILLLIMFAPFSGYSMTVDLNKDGWFFISNIDVVALLFFDLLLLFVFLEQNKTLKTVISQYDEKLLKKKNKEDKEVKEESITKILTGIVAVEDEASILLDHDFDGIRELDNNLPPWWVWSFYASIVFAFFYLIHYHVTKTGDLQIAEYDKSVAAAQVEIDEYMSAMAMNVDESNVTILTESTDINNGKALFATNCVVCHKEKGEGLIGPNLTDKHWLTGNGSINEVFKVIKYGTTNGMPEHESKMNPVELQQVASFVLQLEFTEGKAPEGEEVK